MCSDLTSDRLREHFFKSFSIDLIRLVKVILVTALELKQFWSPVEDLRNLLYMYS